MQQSGFPSYIPTAPAQPQPAPVQSVACPAYTPPSGQHPGQTVQQQWQQRMVAIARPLEQTIPGYQVMAAIAQELLGAGGSQAAGLESVIATIKDVNFHLSTTLGAIRRFLCGEANAAMLTALAENVNRLARTQSLLRPQLDRLVMAASPDQRPALSGLAQTLSAAESLLNQAGSAIQTTVGPQIWDAVRNQVWATALPGVSTLPEL